MFLEVASMSVMDQIDWVGLDKGRNVFCFSLIFITFWFLLYTSNVLCCPLWKVLQMIFSFSYKKKFKLLHKLIVFFY